MCVMTIATTNLCDCPGNTLASGVLIDNVIPNIDTTQRGTWARELFVVNRNGQNSIVIGFQFISSFMLRNVEVTYFDCPIWDIGVTSINIYSSPIFPSFVTAVSTNVGMLSLVSDSFQSCTSFRTVSIPVQASESSLTYFVEFSYIGGSSINTPSWLYLAEIEFSDTAPMMPGIMTTSNIGKNKIIMYTPNNFLLIVTLFLCAIATSEYISVPVTTREELSPPTSASLVSNATITSFTESNEVIQSTTEGMNATIGLTAISDVENTVAPTVPVALIVGILAGVIIFLVLLIILGGAFISCFAVHNKRHLNRLKVRQLQYIVTEDPVHELESISDMNDKNRKSIAINSHYLPANHLNLGPSSLSRGSGSSESDLYSEVRDANERGRNKTSPTDVNSGVYDDIHENKYAYIPEVHSEASSDHQAQEIPRKKQNYTLIQKQTPPPIPDKSSELKEYLGVKIETEGSMEENWQKEKGEHPDGHQTENEQYYSEIPENNKRAKKASIDNLHYAQGSGGAQPQMPTIEIVSVGIYSEVGEDMKTEENVDYYMDIDGNRTPSRSPSRSRCSSRESGPVLLSRPVCDAMEENPTYDNSGSLLQAFISHEDEIYTDPDDRFNKQSENAVYEAVYSDASVQPSLFKKQIVGEKEKLSGWLESEQRVPEENDDENEIVKYAPIYTLQDSSPIQKREPLVVNNDNI